MLERMKNRWRLLSIRGYISLGIGLFFFLQPQMSVVGMLRIFSVMLLISGISLVILGLIVENENRLLRITESFGFFTASVLIFLNSAGAFNNIFLIVAAWAAITGIIEIFISYMLRKLLPGEWFLIVNGFISLFFSIINAYGIFEETGMIIIAYGSFTILNGLFILFFAYKIRYIRIWS